MVKQDLSGRNCIVTGANTGIGLVTAKELAKAGARVFVAARSPEKGKAACEQIASSLADDSQASVEFMQLDLADLEKVAAFANEFCAKEIPLDILVNNAGLAGHRGQSAQGFELQFGVNHLGPFLLTQLLMPALRRAEAARIVNVASRGHLKAPSIPWEKLEKKTDSVAGFKEYCVSKLANVLFTIELANRIPETMSTYSLHPGVIKSDIWRRIPWPIRSFVTRKMITVEEGAQTSLYCATEPGLESQSGTYFNECAPSPINPIATAELASELWQRSEDWCTPWLDSPSPPRSN